MGQANVRKRKCGCLYTQGLLLQQQGECFFFGKIHPKTEHLTLGKFFLFMPSLVIILQVMGPWGIYFSVCISFILRPS